MAPAPVSTVLIDNGGSTIKAGLLGGDDGPRSDRAFSPCTVVQCRWST